MSGLFEKYVAEKTVFSVLSKDLDKYLRTLKPIHSADEWDMLDHIGDVLNVRIVQYGSQYRIDVVNKNSNSNSLLHRLKDSLHCYREGTFHTSYTYLLNDTEPFKIDFDFPKEFTVTVIGEAIVAKRRVLKVVLNDVQGEKEPWHQTCNAFDYYG